MDKAEVYRNVKALVVSRSDEFVHQWLDDGIFYEGDFGFSSHILEYHHDVIQRVLQEFGCPFPEDESVMNDIADKVEEEGWMYALYDTARYEPKEVIQMIHKKFTPTTP